MTDNKVTITLTTGDTMEVHTGTHVLAGVDDRVITVLEPMREFWTPYEPWMRDVLADDARVSEMVGYEIRCTWGRLDGEDEDPDDADLRAVNLRVHPDDVPERRVPDLLQALLDSLPERPTEDDPDEALAEVLREVMADDWTATDLAHAAREHLMGELHDRAEEVERRLMSATRRADHAEAAMRAEVKDHDATRARAEKAKAERDEWREVAGLYEDGRDKWMAAHDEMRDERDALAERWGKSDADLTDATYELAGLRSEVDQWKHVATVRGKREVWLAKERDKCATLAEKWQARHAALRVDVDEFHYKHREHPLTWELIDALARDTMRGQA